jgi:hypothetical protein
MTTEDKTDGELDPEIDPVPLPEPETYPLGHTRNPELIEVTTFKELMARLIVFTTTHRGNISGRYVYCCFGMLRAYGVQIQVSMEAGCYWYFVYNRHKATADGFADSLRSMGVLGEKDVYLPERLMEWQEEEKATKRKDMWRSVREWIWRVLTFCIPTAIAVISLCWHRPDLQPELSKLRGEVEILKRTALVVPATQPTIPVAGAATRATK